MKTNKYISKSLAPNQHLSIDFLELFGIYFIGFTDNKRDKSLDGTGDKYSIVCKLITC